MRKLQLETRVCDSCGKESEPQEIGISPPGWVTTEDAAVQVIVDNHTLIMGDVCDNCSAHPFIVAIQTFREMQRARMQLAAPPRGMTPSEQLAHQQGLAEIAALPPNPPATEIRSLFDGTESDPA